MWKQKFSWLFRFELLLVFTAIAIFSYFQQAREQSATLLKPVQSYQLALRMQFNSADKDVNISTFVPHSNERQQVLTDTSQSNYLAQSLFPSYNGLVSRWSGTAASDSIDYKAQIQTSGYQFSLSDSLEVTDIDQQKWQNYLQASEHIQVGHPEIAALWQQIQPDDNNNVVKVLEAIYQYTADIESIPFKGTTDALTALRLGAASCNGKSRLFVALARHNGIPARLVGGLVLNEGSKKTSHQWLEVNIENQWIPFDPTNHYFAQLPAHYLELYRGDKSLFTHTANIDFDYQFTINKNLISPALYQTSQVDDTRFDIARLLQELHLPAQTAAVFLVLPFCALLITVFRNLFGLKSFGIFMPMLVGSACAFVGLTVGLMGFVMIVVIAFIGQIALHGLNLLKIPRLAAIITLVNAATFSLLLLLDQFSTIEIGLLSLFPVIIITFIADKLYSLVEQRSWMELSQTMAGSAVSIILCYLCISSATLQGIFVLYPEAYLLVLAAQVYMGRWTGLRLTELVRFKQVLQNTTEQNDGAVVGINKRNRDFVASLNSREDLLTAADKLATKALLQKHNIPVPSTIAAFNNTNDLTELEQHLNTHREFVIKPNAGSQGKGILVIRDKSADGFVSANGKTVSKAEITKLIKDTIGGKYSQLEKSDTAYIEPLIHQHLSLNNIAPYGLCDIRVVVIKKQVVSAMLRIPTLGSSGKANLHQGALGAAINLKTGEIERCLCQGQVITHHPDSNAQVTGVVLPFWSKIVEMSQACSEALGLGYMGVDICLDEYLGPLVLELNGRPGLEIQNINKSGLMAQFQPSEPADTAFSTAQAKLA
ncbi:hypothetical protein HR060_07370 [Catenovulum sp. SM1970]|uniref:sugar-transfer associated ATP-grasp domain-containing protein n=1 Tax=Marinifaba aquimaris TaxID=2741323 RepID=UPI0015722B1F|nr:sugar-transfer associated ATP-grasp domain-containing protein [Marinifaba aquimaris]NTS76686.1 hypothetical protein [Marinifaba aquimaris]